MGKRKYSFELKKEIVSEYLSGKTTYHKLSRKYGIANRMQMAEWVANVQARGYESLRPSGTTRKFSPDFKLSVVNYYKTSGLGSVPVAVHFGISSVLVSKWHDAFEREGIAGLRTKPARKKTIMSRKKIIPNKPVKLSEREQYEQEITKLRAELYQTKMERDILKKLRAVSKNSHQDKKQK